ncbi:hypothetical protein [Actinomycetospora cinnamomea]|uniref:Uncharacterized protein n=1 Tax=Actinomycetospora cinnamomea TaxID=663609 RepID=A0A2U1FL85_9PSEU|nr:hypothetical protein [Actinomycetospora cinnamomea]PVZ12886.1 hypothetical protein C8D89_10234 [Actinomycetospora cinnamomea]
MTPEPAAAPRAVLLGVSAAVLGVAAHGEAGGAVAATAPATVVAVLVVLATALVGARPGSPGRTVGVLAAGQLALHLSLPAGHTDHAHHGPAATPHGPGMVLAHLAVAVVVGGAIVRADRAAREAFTRVGTAWRWWPVLLAGVTPPAGPRPRTGRPGPAAPGAAARAAVGHHPRRGPPSTR